MSYIGRGPYNCSETWTNFPFLWKRLFIHRLYKKLLWIDWNKKDGTMTRFHIGFYNKQSGYVNYSSLNDRFLLEFPISKTEFFYIKFQGTGHIESKGD